MRLVHASAAASRVALVTASAAALLSGCHVPGTGGSGSGASGSGSITVAAVPGIDNAPLQVAVDDGLFRQHGLTVTIRDYQTAGAEVQALRSGDAQIAAGDYTQFFDAEFTGAAKLRLLADGYDAVANYMAVLTLPGSSITTPQDLANKTVAAPIADSNLPKEPAAAPFNIETMATEQVLQSDGVSPSSVNWIKMPMQSMISALQNHTVQAILVSEPYVYEAESQLGAVEVLDSCSGVTAGLPLSGYFSLAAYASKNGSNVQAFQAALSQAQGDSAMGGPVKAVLPHYAAGVNTQDAALATIGTYPTALSVGQVQRVADLMYDSGMTTSPVSVRSLVYP